MCKEILNTFLEKYKEFHKNDPETWKKQKRQEVDLYVNKNAEKKLPIEFLKKIQSSDVFQICIRN